MMKTNKNVRMVCFKQTFKNKQNWEFYCRYFLAQFAAPTFQLRSFVILPRVANKNDAK